MEIPEMSDKRLSDELIFIRKRIRDLRNIQKQIEDEQERRFEKGEKKDEQI